MSLNLITFANKLGELTYDDMDNNWSAIMAAVNGAAGNTQLYQIMDASASNSCQKDGSNLVTLSAQVKLLQAYTRNPVLRYAITLNGVLVAGDQVSGYFTGQNFPFAINTQGGELLNLQIPVAANAYPATITIYLWDESNNYATPVSVVIEVNPCA